MKVEKIHDNKVSVFISMLDLKERNINLYEFYPQSSKIQSLFLDILEEAYVQQGFEADASQLYVETKPLPNHGFHISITKFDDEDELEDDYSSGYIINEIGDFLEEASNHKQKQELVYRFKTIESINPVMEYLNEYDFEQTNLFKFDKNYILTLVVSDSCPKTYSKLSAFLAEYGIRELFSIAYIDEHGKRILYNNALEGLIQYFDLTN